MFERAACPDQPRLATAPFVSMSALTALSDLIDQPLKSLAKSSNALISGTSESSHDQNRGEAHGQADIVPTVTNTDRGSCRIRRGGSWCRVSPRELGRERLVRWIPRLAWVTEEAGAAGTVGTGIIDAAPPALCGSAAQPAGEACTPLTSPPPRLLQLWQHPLCPASGAGASRSRVQRKHALVWRMLGNQASITQWRSVNTLTPTRQTENEGLSMAEPRVNRSVQPPPTWSPPRAIERLRRPRQRLLP